MEQEDIKEHEKGVSLGRSLALWLASYLVVGIGLFCYVRIPIGPLLIAGVLTGIVTIVRHRVASQRREKPVSHRP